MNTKAKINVPILTTSVLSISYIICIVILIASSGFKWIIFYIPIAVLFEVPGFQPYFIIFIAITFATALIKRTRLPFIILLNIFCLLWVSAIWFLSTAGF